MTWVVRGYYADGVEEHKAGELAHTAELPSDFLKDLEVKRVLARSDVGTIDVYRKPARAV